MAHSKAAEITDSMSGGPRISPSKNARLDRPFGGEYWGQQSLLLNFNHPAPVRGTAESSSAMSEAIRSPAAGPTVGEWQAVVIFFSRVKLTTGEYSSPPELLMKRRENGVWCYRHPTADEEADYVSSDAW